MRSPIASVACALALAGSAFAQAPGQPPTREQIDSVMAELRQHPDLAGSRVERSLQFKRPAEEKRKEAKPDPSFWRWLADFVRWLSEASRWLVWLLGALAVALLAVRLRGWWRERADLALPRASSAPTHVRDLDIRPQTLPPDIGAAALALWRDGKLREALSLLYRGALSRLVHGHAVPIRASSTEGDCLLLASPALAASSLAYLELLITAWQRAVYAERPPSDEQMRLLCATFDARLGAAEAAT
jgi:hypothetical protein